MGAEERSCTYEFAYYVLQESEKLVVPVSGGGAALFLRGRG